MRVLLLAGFFSAIAAPGAFAVESTKACELDDTRRAAAEASAPPPEAGVRRAEAAPRAVAAAPAVAAPARRRGGKRIPDSELMGPRGAL
jgi:hypothetical protein